MKKVETFKLALKQALNIPVVSGSIFTKIQNIFHKYFGKIEYVITIVNVSGSVKHYIFYNLKDVNGFVNEINAETYWDVQKIEKFRKFEYTYKNRIIHSPLHFCLDDVTEKEYVTNHDYSFLKKHKSLENINRVSSKECIVEAVS